MRTLSVYLPVALALGACGFLPGGGDAAQAQQAQQLTTEAMAPVTAAERQSVINDLAKALEERYVFPDTGRLYAEALRKALASGAYDSLSDPAVFAKRLTTDLRAVSADRHLGVRKPGTANPMAAPASAAPVEMPPALADARMIADGVAYLRFDLFSDEKDVAAAARKFLLDHADARAVIIDCRANPGGSTMIMNAILPLFYAKKTTLVRMDTRESVAADFIESDDKTLVIRKGPKAFLRQDHVITPDRTENRLFDAKLFYLTSKRTGSVAEHLALALKRTGRATVIGETTAGAGHYGDFVPLGRFSAFIPVGRTYDPDTGEGWERVGVTPNIRVPADQALDVALKLSGATVADDKAVGPVK